MKYFSLLLLTSTFSIVSMELEKLSLLQQIYTNLELPKEQSECAAILNQVQELDTLAARIKMPNVLPFNAPWRDSYRAQIDLDKKIEKPKLCPFCDQFSRPQDDTHNFILERNTSCVLMFNRSAYLPLHFLIIPYKHVSKLTDLSDDERHELLQKGSIWLHKLKKIGVGGANFHFNLESKSAGASLPEHLHGHILSRWSGDESALTWLIGQDIIAQEHKLLFASFAPFNEKKLGRVFQPFCQLLASKADYKEKNKECYVCHVIKDETQDFKNLMVKRFKEWHVMLYRFGYAAGHLLLLSNEHGKSFDTLTPNQLAEFNQTLILCQEKLKETLTFDGYNISINEGTCSGNPFADHVCCNIIGRTQNDTSATAVLCGRPIMEKNLDLLCKRLQENFK